MIGTTFNFLRDEDPSLDAVGAAATRRANLLRYLHARENAPIVAVGEAAGFQGARWTGIAFTSERTLLGWDAAYQRTYGKDALKPRPKGWSEPSGTIVHRVLEELDAELRVILWNVVPTHPHRGGAPLSNRPPSRTEIEQGVAYACRLIELVRPERVIAIGRVAESGLRSCGHAAEYVRHPSYGGRRAFEEGMRRLLI